MEEKRFSGVIGEEYELWKQVMPHYKQMQQTVGTLLRLLYGRDRNEQFRAVDLGCGTGTTSKIILDSIPRAHVYVVDNEPVMLNQAENNLDEYNYGHSKRVRFIQKDILECLEEHWEGTYDVIVSAQTLHNFSQNYRESVLQEIYKTLKFGGIFINADKYALNDPIAHQKALERQLRQIKSVYGKIGRLDLVKAWTAHCLRDNEPDLLMRQQEAIDQMTAIGFQDIIIPYRKEMDAILVAVKPG